MVRGITKRQRLIRAASWLLPVLLFAGAVSARILGTGNDYGLVEPFNGDLATDNALRDSSDNTIEIAAGNDVCWLTGGENTTCIYGGNTGGLLELYDYVDEGDVGFCMGPSGNNPPCLKYSGEGNTATIKTFTNGNLGVLDLLKAEFRSSIVAPSHGTEIANNLVGLIGSAGAVNWGASSPSDNGIAMYGFNIASNSYYVSTSNKAGTADTAVHDGTFRMGDMKSGTPGTLPACDSKTHGVLNFANGGTLENESLSVCVQELDNGSQVSRWAGFGTQSSHWYWDPQNVATATTVSGGGTWNKLTGIGPVQLWNRQKESGWRLQADDTFDVSGTWPVDSGGTRLFEISYNISFYNAGGGGVYTFSVAVNDNEAPTVTIQNCYSTVSQIVGSHAQTAAASCIVTMDVDGTNNDDWYLVVSGSLAINITIYDANVSIRAM